MVVVRTDNILIWPAKILVSLNVQHVYYELLHTLFISYLSVEGIFSYTLYGRVHSNIVLYNFDSIINFGAYICI